MMPSWINNSMTKMDKLRSFRKKNGYKGWIMLLARVFYALFTKPFLSVLSVFFWTADPKQIVFESKPDFSDNARTLFDFMVKSGLHEKYQITWLVARPDLYDAYHAKNVRFLKREGTYSGHYTMRAHISTWKAGTLFYTHSMYQLMHRPRGQQRINLWHGCGYKAAKGDSQKIAFDHLLVPSPLFVKTKAAFFERSETAFWPIGYPRYDEIVAKNEHATRCMKKLKEEHRVNKVLLWMPTYRGCENARFNDDTIAGSFQLPLVQTQEDLLSLQKLCKRNRILLLIKYHEMQKAAEELAEQENIQIIDNAWFEKKPFSLYHFLGVVDGLITDYSSVAVDFLLVDKPLAYVLTDYEEYKQSRGFVFDDPLKYMPGHHIFAWDGMEDFLNQIGRGEDCMREERQCLFKLMHTPFDCYCKEVLKKAGLMDR